MQNYKKEKNHSRKINLLLPQDVVEEALPLQLHFTAETLRNKLEETSQPHIMYRK